MAMFEYYQQKEKEAKDELDKANTALQTFRGSKYRGEKLDELRNMENLNARDKTVLERLIEEEAWLKNDVVTYRKEWIKSKDDLRRADTSGNDFVLGRWGYGVVQT